MNNLNQTSNLLKYHFAFSLILLCAVGLRVSFYMGPSGADDVIYYSVIEKLLLNEDIGKTITSSMHWGIRLGMIFPVWAFMELFGVSPFSTYLYPMILSIGTLFFIYIASLKLFNPAVALIASFCFAILPQDVYLAGVIYPDGPVILFASLFIYFFYRVSLNENVDIAQSIVIGLILGLGYYVRETAVILLIAVPILFFKTPNKKNYFKSVLLVLAGLSIAIGLEMLVVWLLTGDPLARFKILLGESKVLEPREFKAWGPNYTNAKSEYSKYLFEPFVVIFATYWISPMMMLLAAGLPVMLIMKKKNNTLMSTWNGHFLWLAILTFGILAYYTHGPIYGFTMPLKRSVRYYHIIAPLAAILTGVVLYELLKQKGFERLSGYLLIVFYISSSFFCLGSIVNKNAHGIEMIDEFIAQNPAENYVMPMMLKNTLKLMRGQDFPQKKVMTYQYRRKAMKNDRRIFSLLTDIRKEGKKQYLFVIPKLHEIQNNYKRHIKWPMDKLELVEVMTATPGISCRIMKASDYVYSITPNLFKSKICYTTDIYVYLLL